MVGTLIKHEWQRTRTTLWMFIGICVLVVLVGWGGRQAGVVAIAAFGVFTEIVGLIALFVVPMFLIVVDYARSSYLRVGYFTQTLPVKGSTIFWVKFCYGFVVWLVTLVAAVFLAFATNLIPGWREMFDVLNEAPIGWVIGIGAFLLVTLVCYLCQFYAAVTIGYDPTFRRLGNVGWLVGYVIIYMASNVLSLVLLLVPLVARIDNTGVKIESGWLFQQLWENASDPAAEEGLFPLGFVASPIVMLAILLPFLVHCWNKRISLR